MANYNILMNRFNGTTHDTLLPKNSLEGTTDPTTSTVGIVGQFYLNITTKRLWQCTNVNGSVYTWGVLYPNKNFLDNAWFEVNQRGQSSYTAGYCIDRFFITGNLTVTVNADGTITITGNGASGGSLRQIVGLNLTVEQYTASVNVLSLTDHITLFMQKNGGDYNTFVQKAVTSTGIISASGTPNASAQYNIVLEVPNGASATLKSGKLELGPVSTLHFDTPPSPAEQELNRQVCKRYYQLWTDASARTEALKSVGLMRLASPTLGTQVIGGTTYYSASADL